MSRKSRKMTGKMDAVKAFESSFAIRRPNKDLVLVALRELVSNAGDAGANLINIVLDAKKRVFRVEDNGHGFDEEHQKGYLTLFASVKNGKLGQTGQWGTGRTKAMAFAPELKVFSVSSGFPNGTQTTLTRAMLQELFIKHAVEGEWIDDAKLPEWWHLEKRQTGSAIVIEINDEDWRYVPSPESIIAELARYLKISVAEKVTVNGKKLQKRDIVGEPIRRIFGAEELGTELFAAFGGSVEVELFIPAGTQQSDEEVRLGGHHPICPLKQLIKQIGDPDLTGSIPKILLNKVIVGDLFFPNLNSHVGEDRESLKDSVLKGFHLHMIDFLSNILGPIVVDTFERHETDRVRDEHAATLRSFVSTFNLATGMDADVARHLQKGKSTKGSGTGSTDIVDAPIVVNRREVELCPGDTQTLKVIRLNGVDEKHLEWIETTGGQEKHLANSSSFSYIAEALGTFVIVVRDKTRPTISVDVTIQVERKKSLVITPGKARIERGGSQDFRVRYSDATSGSLRWEVLTAKGGKATGVRLQNSKGLAVTLEVGDSAPLGKYTLRVTDSKDVSITAETDFMIHQDIPPDLLMIDGMYYRVSASNSLQGTPVILTQDDEWAPSGDAMVGTILVNFHHTDFKNAATIKLEQNFLLQELVIMAHCEAESVAGKIGSISEFGQKVATLRSMLLQTSAGM